MCLCNAGCPETKEVPLFLRSFPRPFLKYWFLSVLWLLGRNTAGSEGIIWQQIQKQTVTQRYVLVAFILADPAIKCISVCDLLCVFLPNLPE